MPTIYFNDKLRRNLNSQLFQVGFGTPATDDQYNFINNWNNSGPGYNTYGNVKLMKGTVPTDFSGLTTSTSRSSDTLVTWATNVGSWTYGTPTTNIDGIAEIDSPYATASASGIATWFWWYINEFFSTNIILQLAGTVGTSGADLIIGDTTIIAGANYRFQNLKFDVPTVYTY